MRQKTIQNISVSECESGPKPWHFGAPFEQGMTGEKIGLGGLRGETKRFELAVTHSLQVPAERNQLNMRFQQIRTGRNNAFLRLTIEPV